MKTNKEKSRRKFIKTAGKATVVVPASTVILNAVLIPEAAAVGSVGQTQIDPPTNPD